MVQIEIREERTGGVLIVSPEGRLDTNTSPQLEKRLLQHLAAGERSLLVDMAGIGYISSAGLRVLLLVAKRLREISGRVVLCSLGSAVRQVFELSGFLAVLDVEASREAALARLTQRG